MKHDVLVFSDPGKTRINIIPEKLSSTDTLLTFSLRDTEDKAALEALCRDAEATRIITYGRYDDETLNTAELKKYAQYTGLTYMGTQYGQVAEIDYDTEDPDTESGFAEIRADITEVQLKKKSYVQRQIDAIRDGGAAGGDYVTQDQLAAVQSSVDQIEGALTGEEDNNGD